MIVNNIRKYRVSLSLVFQGLSQIEEKYGLAKAKSIKAGISSTLVFAGADHISAKEISDRIGEKVTLQRKEYDEIQDSYAKISLISADKIRTLNSGEALFLSANRDPFIVKVAPFYISKSPYNKASKKAGYILPIQQPQLPLQINI